MKEPQNMKNFKFTYLLISILITGCGFHLRGSQDFSKILPEVNVSGINKHSDLGRELLRSLTAAKVNVLDESSTVLRITNDSFSKRVLSVDSAGRANQYELQYNVAFTLVKTLGNRKQEIIDLIPSQNIIVKREYLFDANLILAAQDEENRLKKNMRESAMLQLMRYLKFSLKENKEVN